MALGLLSIMFTVMIVVSILGIGLLYFIKNPKSKNFIFYFLCGWAMFIAFINATGLPSNYILEQILAWSFGLLAIISLIIKIKRPDKVSLCYALLSASVLLGLFDLLFF